MTRRLFAVGLLALVVGCSVSAPSETPPAPSGTATSPAASPDTPKEPPMPFVDSGACPFEGCQYGNWTARTEIVALKDPPLPWNPGAHDTNAVFRIAKGEKVFAAA